MAGLETTPPRSPSRVIYWLKGQDSQNFGDYLSELFAGELFEEEKTHCDAYHLVGSILDDAVIAWYRRLSELPAGTTVGYWGCGCRQDIPLSQESKAASVFFGVRGPLTLRLLDLPADTPIGDPGLTLPAFYEPRRSDKTASRTVCVPHFCDTKTSEELIALSGAEKVVKPAIPSTIPGLKEKIDEIVSADFVLAGSLHGAVLACAYDVPFAFWDNGHLDIPFKWRDFAASIGIPACFVGNLEQGRIAYERIIAPALRKPKLLPILMAAPFTARSEALKRAGEIDAGKRQAGF